MHSLRHAYTVEALEGLCEERERASLTLCAPMDHTVHGILQARILECGSCVLTRRARGEIQPVHTFKLLRSGLKRGFEKSLVIQIVFSGSSHFHLLRHPNASLLESALELPRNPEEGKKCAPTFYRPLILPLPLGPDLVFQNLGSS